MADFHQNIVPTITRLESEDLGRMHQRIVDASKRRPIGVIMAATFRDLSTPVTRGMIDDLVKMAFVERAYISLQDATPTHYRKALEIVEPLGTRGVVLWNDAPPVQAMVERIQSAISIEKPGKGRAVWAALGYALAKADVAVLAFHDANIATYNRAFLVRLLYPVVHLRFQFAKAFYARYSEDQLHGRVARLFYFPFARALREILPRSEFLEYMADFRYPLSGEFATYTTVAHELQLPPDWGVEVAVLAGMHKIVQSHRVCQVEITQRYNQRHPETGTNPSGGLQRMAADVAATFFAQLSSRGVALDSATLLALKHTYLTHARSGVRVYEAYADINNVANFNPHKELKLIETFAVAIGQAFADFQNQLTGLPLLPDWRRIESAVAGVLPDLVKAFEHSTPKNN